MWRYLAGAGAALLLVAAGFFLFNGRASTGRGLPAAPGLAASQDAPAGALPATVPEASERTREEKRFDRYDKDRNGAITREEYLLSRRKAYARLDADHDGKLSFDEWAIKTTGKFAKADADQSGTMNAAEFLTTKVKRTPRSRPVCPPASADDD